MMFEEISRLLSCPGPAAELGGTYMCVTLAENFIVSHLISHFSSVGTSSGGLCWDVAVRTIPVEQSDPSPFTPFLIEVTRRRPAATRVAFPGEGGTVRLHFNQFGDTLARGSERVMDIADCLRQLVHVQVRASINNCVAVLIYSLISSLRHIRTRNILRNVSSWISSRLGASRPCIYGTSRYRCKCPVSQSSSWTW
jgi:hypothetical protein